MRTAPGLVRGLGFSLLGQALQVADASSIAVLR